MKIPLQPIKPRKISDQVFDQLRELIFREEFKPGEQLLPERELAEALGVSRTSVRNAINKLVVMGLLEQKQGQGTFVKQPERRPRNPLEVAMRPEEATLEHLLEFRMGMECNAAYWAAMRAVEKDLHFLEKSIAEMKIEVASGRLGTEADVAFHMAIAYATQNPIHVQLMRQFYDFLFVGIKENLSFLYENPQNIEEILKQHRAIFEAIGAHRPERAFDAMHRHITFVLEFFKARR
jgi:GntR family transcriptional repressor for pyruvate dehydrogenase complex